MHTRGGASHVRLPMVVVDEGYGEHLIAMARAISRRVRV